MTYRGNIPTDHRAPMLADLNKISLDCAKNDPTLEHFSTSDNNNRTERIISVEFGENYENSFDFTRFSSEDIDDCLF